MRKDFPRNFPHIFPGAKDEFVKPCIYDGSLDDLLHQGLGLTQILYQVQDWLNNAASNSLINSNQGWEPIRYDSIGNFIIYEHSRLRSLASEKAGSAFLYVDSFTDKFFALYRLHDYAPKPLDDRYASFVTQTVIEAEKFQRGVRPLLFCWPDEGVEVSEYFPETVTKLRELIEKSKKYGTYHNFWSEIQQLWTRLGSKSTEVEVIAVHCVRRPLPLIHQHTKLELLAYRVRAAFNFLGVPDMEAPVEIIGHLHAVGPDLLQQMSGSQPAKMESIIQIGCGSLGSKIAMHLGRAGHGPLTLIDNKNMSEHNLARHVLIKTAGNKAELLKGEMDILNVGVTASPKSLQDFVARNENRLFKKKSLVIDSTASINGRETLASLPVPQNGSRIFQTGLYSRGRLGFITIEGEERNPRVDDLHASIFDAAIDNKAISDAVMGADNGFQRQSTGQGCGSYTMVIPDTKISMYSAAMAERARQAFEGNLQNDGEISVGGMTDTGLSLTWETSSVGKTRVVDLDNKDWELRILASAFVSMEQEVGKWNQVETGGVLIGRLCLTRKCAIITRVLEAPPDSIRTPGRFVLGTAGLKSQVAKIAQASGLTYLGTWHSHLFGSTPSGVDDAMLKRVRDLRLGIPAFNLIWHNRELTCFADYGNY